MSGHSLLSPSGAHRWLNCPLAPRLEAELPDKSSAYADEGSLAHSVCEITAKKYFKKVKAAEYNKEIKKLRTNSLWNDEMLSTAEKYVEHIIERAMGFDFEPYFAFEVKVDITDYVPEAGGTCDCVMVGGDTLVITDYKHGKGVPVSPMKNPQLMLYALGALKLYKTIYGDTIRNVEIFIDQPRLNFYEGWTCEVSELLDWGANIKPKAELAFMGIGDYNAGDWCQFCRANGICKAQAETQLSTFDDFSSTIDKKPQNPALLTPIEVGAALEKGKNLAAWYECLKQRALEMLLDGRSVPGWKAVEGRSTRIWTDQDSALDLLQQGGIDRAIIYDSVPKSLAQLEKVVGVSEFDKIVGAYVVKPQGKPTLVPESDSRRAFNSAVADFAAVTNQNLGGQDNV